MSASDLFYGNHSPLGVVDGREGTWHWNESTELKDGNLVKDWAVLKLAPI